MLSYLIRRAVGPGGGGFWAGLVMVLAGVGLTIFSATISDALGLHITFVFYGLIVIGLVRMAASLRTLFGGGGTRRQQMTGGPAMPQYYAPPFQVTPGYCWQCGGKVKRNATMCLHCGATQAAEKEESDVAHLSGFGLPAETDNIPPPMQMPATNGPRWANTSDSGYGGYGSGNDSYGPVNGGYGPGSGGYDQGNGGYGPSRTAGGRGGPANVGGSSNRRGNASDASRRGEPRRGDSRRDAWP